MKSAIYDEVDYVRTLLPEGRQTEDRRDLPCHLYARLLIIHAASFLTSLIWLTSFCWRASRRGSSSELCRRILIHRLARDAKLPRQRCLLLARSHPRRNRQLEQKDVQIRLPLGRYRWRGPACRVRSIRAARRDSSYDSGDTPPSLRHHFDPRTNALFKLTDV